MDDPPALWAPSPLASNLLANVPPVYDDIFGSTDALPDIHLASFKFSNEQENERPARARADLSVMGENFHDGVITPGMQVINFRIMCALASDRVLTWPELIISKRLFIDGYFWQDLLVAGIKSKKLWYMYDPEDAVVFSTCRWWEFTGAEYRDFLRRLCLPSFIPVTTLLDLSTLSFIPNPNGSIGPRPVRSHGAIITKLLSNLTARDLAYATAGTTITPVPGKTYSFADLYPPAAEFTIEDACRVNGLSTAKTLRFSARQSLRAPALQSDNVSVVNTPPRTPLRSLPSSLHSSPAPPPLLALISGSSPSSIAPTTPTTSRWGSSSTAYASSPTPPSEFDDEDSDDEQPARNWKTGQRVRCAPGRTRMPYPSANDRAAARAQRRSTTQGRDGA
ncbi:hypothetical protein BD626DRAFT_579012 [Schizophyllum amplum]|uniref:Uncharacterized protein n=1 Tax=Schizophyllum amplum TaxID=97359 RepID=A0A550BRQ6_9AGAR|nr:hypothetical protein BD626DRAFT_579012 [Auriculariopsis ampla]